MGRHVDQRNYLSTRARAPALRYVIALLLFWIIGSECSVPTSQYATVSGPQCPLLDLLAPQKQDSDRHRWDGLAGHNMWIKCNGTDRALFYRNNQQLIMTPSDGRFYVNGNNLAIAPVHTSDSGTYHCATVNGNCVSNTFPVFVIKEGLKLEVKTPKIRVEVGETILVRVNVTNLADCGPFTVVWSHHGMKLLNDRSVRIWQEKSYLNLNIFNATLSDHGIYTLAVITRISNPKTEIIIVSVIAPTLSPTLGETTEFEVHAFTQQITSSKRSPNSSSSDEVSPSYSTQVSGSAKFGYNLGIIFISLLSWLGSTTLFAVPVVGVGYRLEQTMPRNVLEPTGSFLLISRDSDDMESEWDNLISSGPSP